MVLEEFSDQRDDDKDIYSEYGLEEEEDEDRISAEEMGFMQGYLAA